MCTADYGPSCYDETNGIADMPCGEGGFIGCRRIDGFCRTDLDCYNTVFPADGGVSSDLMYCPNGNYTCQYGQCVYTCGTGCQSDYDCAAGERCEVTCYACTADGQCPGCEGVCVPAEDCQVTGCPAGFECQVSCYDCAGGTEDCLGGCTGVCVEVQVFCSSDADCPAGYACQWPDGEDYPCDPETGCGKMAGVCVPVSIGCYSDADCPAGFVCQLMPCDCVNPDETGWCEECYAQMGQCVPGPQDCQVTGCPEGYECQVSCADCAPDAKDCLGGCVGTCVPVQPPCYSDADCAAGEVCQMNCPVCEPGYDCFVACMGVCVPVQPQCWSDADCALGETCQLTCPECPAGAECDVACSGVCVPAQQFCTSDAECSAGQVCVVDSWCTPDSWCGGVCTNVVWMSFAGVQCSSTAWELDAQQNPALYSECMVDCGAGTDCGSGWVELCILQKFFGLQGIVTYDARNVQDATEVCAACGCPRGNTLYLLVKEGDVGLLEGYGFWPMTVGIK